MLVLVPFFVAPILVVLVASFFETDGFGGLMPTFTLANYVDGADIRPDVQPLSARPSSSPS